VKGAVLKVAGSPTIPLGVGHGDTNVDNSRHFPQTEIRGSSPIQGNHPAETSRARRPSADRIPEKQVSPTSETYEEPPSRVNFLSPGMETPMRIRCYIKDEITIVPEPGRQNSHNASSDPNTTTSKKSRIASRILRYIYTNLSSKDKTTIVPKLDR